MLEKLLVLDQQHLTDILIHLERIYCSSIGIEYMYIRTPERIQWIQEQLNRNSNSPNFSVDQKKQILKKTIEAVTFEKFLHTKYVGQKRFSLEGGEALIPALDALIEKAANDGVKEVCSWNGSQRKTKYSDKYFW